MPPSIFYPFESGLINGCLMLIKVGLLKTIRIFQPISFFHPFRPCHEGTNLAKSLIARYMLNYEILITNVSYTNFFTLKGNLSRQKVK